MDQRKVQMSQGEVIPLPPLSFPVLRFHFSAFNQLKKAKKKPIATLLHKPRLVKRMSHGRGDDVTRAKIGATQSLDKNGFGFYIDVSFPPYHSLVYTCVAKSI